VAGQTLNQAFRQADMRTSANETFHNKVHRLRSLSTGKHPREQTKDNKTEPEKNGGFVTGDEDFLLDLALQFELQVLLQCFFNQAVQARQFTTGFALFCL